MKDVARRARAIGWTGLGLSALAGSALETAHGLKLAGYLDDELARLLLRLSHAHGAGLSLILLAFAVAGAPHLAAPRARSIGRGLVAALVLMPLGFGAAAFGHPEGDPGAPIFLVPIGALALLVSLARLALAAWRPDQGPEQ